MSRILRSNHLWVGLILFATFWLTVHLLPVDTVLLISNSLLLAGSTAVAIAYAPVVWQAISQDQAPRFQRIALGIFYAWFFGMLWRVHALIWLKAGSPAWFANNDMIAFYQAGIFLAAMYHLISPGAVGGVRGERMPSLKWVAVGSVVGSAMLLALILSAYTVDTTDLVNALRPYMPR